MQRVYILKGQARRGPLTLGPWSHEIAVDSLAMAISRQRYVEQLFALCKIAAEIRWQIVKVEQ